MSLLEGGMTELFGSVFGAIYLDGVLHRATRTEATNGDVSTVYADAAIKYQPDRITEAMRQADNYSDKDAAFLILQSGVSPAVKKDDQATMGQRWAIKSVESDPANTHWVVRAAPA